MRKKITLATFGGGCFWCTEAIFLEVKGVEKVVEIKLSSDEKIQFEKSIKAFSELGIDIFDMFEQIKDFMKIFFYKIRKIRMT